MIEALTDSIRAGAQLSRADIRSACDALLDASLSIEIRAGFLTALHERGESPAEIAGFVECLLERSTPFDAAGDCIDVCGTGGDKAGFFNVSTTVMFVAAACGVRVVKHGNRGVTSRSGGADVLEALGVRVDLSPDAARRALDAAGCCFLFAPNYHPAFRAIAPVRASLAAQGKTSIFNMLGPLLNPARPSHQLAGVFDSNLLEAYGEVFRLLGRRKAWAVHGRGPEGLRLDEISPLGETSVAALDQGSISHFSILPSDVGLPALDSGAFVGGDATQNARMITEILDGGLRDGPRLIVQLNAAASLVVAGAAGTLAEGFDRAGLTLDSGAARAVLQALKSAC